MVLSSDDDSTFSNVAVTIASGDAVPVKYQVSATTSSAATFELTSPYQGETGYLYEGTTAATNAGIATVTNYGVKLAGIRPEFDVEAFRDYYEVRFNTTFSDNSITVTNSIKASEGAGSREKVALMEYMSMGNQGQNEMLAVPPRPRNTVGIGNCDMFSIITLSWTESVTGLVSTSPAKGAVNLAVELAAGELTDRDTEWAAAATVFDYFTGTTLTTQLDA
jgi:hypothetical protein